MRQSEKSNNRTSHQIMRDLLKLICMATVLLIFTQCGKESDPQPEPVQETWQLTYDDYHVLVSPSDERPEFQNLTRNVTVIRDGNELSIKGIFPEFPDSWIKFTIKQDNHYFTNSDKLYYVNPQIIGSVNGQPVYLHCGYADAISYTTSTSVGHDVSFRPYAETQAAFNIQDDGNTIIAKMGPSEEPGALWYSNSESGSLVYDYGWYKDNDMSTTGEYRGTGFPDTGFMVNVVLQKVSDK